MSDCVKPPQGYFMHSWVQQALADVTFPYELIGKKDHLLLRLPNGEGCAVGGKSSKKSIKPRTAKNTAGRIRRFEREYGNAKK